MNSMRWLALAGMVFGSVGLSGTARAAAYDLHYSFYVTNTQPGGGPTVCTGQCLIDFAESIGVAPPEDLYGEFSIEATGVSRFHERDGWVDPVGLESYYPSRSGSTQVGTADWGRIDLYTFVAGGSYVACDVYQLVLGDFANSCSRLAYPSAPTLRALAAAGTYAPLELPIEFGDGLFGTDGYATFTKVPEPGSFALLGLGLVGLGVSRRRAVRCVGLQSDPRQPTIFKTTGDGTHMNHRDLAAGITALFIAACLLVAHDASATMIERLEFNMINEYGGRGATCEYECLDNLARELGIDVSEGEDLEVGGFVETRGQYTRWRVGNRSGTLGGLGWSVSVNDGTEYQDLCVDAGGPYSDTMGAGFGIADDRGFELSGDSLLCGDAARGLGSFEPASNCEYWCTVRERWYGDGWELWGVVTGVSVRVPEPGSFALLGLGLVGLGVSRWHAAVRSI